MPRAHFYDRAILDLYHLTGQRMQRMLAFIAFAFALIAADVAHGQTATKWVLSGATLGYVMTAEGSPTQPSGATLSLRSTVPTTGFGAASSTIASDTLAERVIELSADIETQGVSKSASVWIRADADGRTLVIDNGMDRGIVGTTSGPIHMVVRIRVPMAATHMAFGLLLSGEGSATARNVRLTSQTALAASAPLAPAAQRQLDSALTIARKVSLWRDTISWAKVEADTRALAAGSQSAAEAYPAIRALLARLGDHHSFLMQPQTATSFRTGGAENPRPTIRVQDDGIGYIDVPQYFGGDVTAARAYVEQVYAGLVRVSADRGGLCRWVVDLRGNGGGNMWPMLGGLRPFLGDDGLGSFAASGLSGTLWHARDVVDVAPPSSLASLTSANVAVLFGPRTASSGEAVAIAFIGRAHSRSFGLPTAGLSSANGSYPMPDGAMIMLTTAIDADRNGKRYGERILPDDAVATGPAAGASDQQIDRAIAWLRSQACSQTPD